MAPSGIKGKNQFQLLMERLPPEHKAIWFAGAALNTSDQAMQSVMSTAMSRLNAFLDSELEQILCFDTAIDAEKFCSQKCAVFVVLPEENPNTFFMVSLLIQQMYREILTVADENGGALDNRLAELEKLIQAAYEDKVMGRIPESVCIQLLNKYEAERTEKLEHKKDISAKLATSRANEQSVDDWLDMIQDYTQLEELDRPTLVRLIQKIEVGEKYQVNDHIERDINIY